VLPDVGHPVVVTAARQITVVHGMGGVGKSSSPLRSHGRGSRLAFEDGIARLKIGRR
jgi:hypothetical protein